MSGPHLPRKGDDHFIREAAIVYIALETLLCHDSSSAENAVACARAYFDRFEGSVHDGDCTKTAMTCGRCVVDDALSEARSDHDDEAPSAKREETS